MRIRIDVDTMGDELYEAIRTEIWKKYGVRHSDEWDLYITLPNNVPCNCGAPSSSPTNNGRCFNCHNILY